MQNWGRGTFSKILRGQGDFFQKFSFGPRNSRVSSGTTARGVCWRGGGGLQHSILAPSNCCLSLSLCLGLSCHCAFRSRNGRKVLFSHQNTQENLLSALRGLGIDFCEGLEAAYAHTCGGTTRCLETHCLVVVLGQGWAWSPISLEPPPPEQSDNCPRLPQSASCSPVAWSRQQTI